MIGNLSTPNTTTILGLLAQNLTATNLANTIIVFTSDHGEYGGAHTLMGKNASSYEEAIHVPLFVRIPNEATMNRQRTQMVSLVDVFGMLSSFASNYSLIPGSPGRPQWQANNPQLASREDLIQFMESNSHRNVKRVLTSGDSGFDKQPYALHTTSEFFANMFSKVAYGNAEKFHVVGLRTGPATSSISASSGLKLVYYYSWDDTYNSAPVFNPTTQPSSSYSEYYNLSADPGEMTNQSSSISSAIHATFSGVINSELQASMGTVNGVNLDGAVLPKAQASYNAYMSPPTGISVSPANPAHSTSSSVTLSISGTNIQRGCQVNVVNPAGVVQEFPMVDFFPMIVEFATGNLGWRGKPRYSDLANRQSIVYKIYHPASSESRTVSIGTGSQTAAVPYIFFTTDEALSSETSNSAAYPINPTQLQNHVTCVRTKTGKSLTPYGQIVQGPLQYSGKFVAYDYWPACTTAPGTQPTQYEFYDYTNLDSAIGVVNFGEIGNQTPVAFGGPNAPSYCPVSGATASQQLFCQLVAAAYSSPGVFSTELAAPLTGKAADGTTNLSSVAAAQEAQYFNYLTSVYGVGPCSS